MSLLFEIAGGILLGGSALCVAIIAIVKWMGP